jgi:hypothetical protein
MREVLGPYLFRPFHSEIHGVIQKAWGQVCDVSRLRQVLYLLSDFSLFLFEQEKF